MEREATTDCTMADENTLLKDHSSKGSTGVLKNRGLIKWIISVIAIIMIFLAFMWKTTPVGTDPKVKELVLKIAAKEIRQQITPVIYTQVTGVPVALIGININYDDLVSNAHKDQNKAVVDRIDKAMANMNMMLKNIRINQIQKELKKSSNSADLVVNGEDHSIQYTAQLNDEGEIYVEVMGLD